MAKSSLGKLGSVQRRKLDTGMLADAAAITSFPDGPRPNIFRYHDVSITPALTISLSEPYDQKVIQNDPSTRRPMDNNKRQAYLCRPHQNFEMWPIPNNRDSQRTSWRVQSQIVLVSFCVKRLVMQVMLTTHGATI
jgi:hypothetical protein